MKKTLFMLLFALMISVIMAMPVLAAGNTGAKAPVYDNTTFFVKRNNIDVQVEVFFANGTPITIEKIEGDEDGTTGALIKWDGGSQVVGSDAYIFGGMHNDDTQVSTSITMNGGTVRAITGGGFHKSYTVESNVVIKDGNVGLVQGGGCDGISWSCGCTANSEDANPSTCQTETANVTIEGGTINNASLSYGLVFGGGEGYSNTETANLTITGGDLTKAYVTAGGSNGNTTEANLSISGGEILFVQTVNRGTIDEATVEITGGTIEDLYVAAENSQDATGKITGTVSVEVSGEAKVTEMSIGQNGGEEVDSTTNTVVNQENIKVATGTVETFSGDMTTNITTMYRVTIDGVEYLLEEGKTVKNISEFSEITKKTGYNFVEFKLASTGLTWSENTVVDSDVELKAVFEEVIEEDDEDTEENEGEDKGEKDETVPTGIETTTLTVFATIAVISLAGLVINRKRK